MLNKSLVAASILSLSAVSFAANDRTEYLPTPERDPITQVDNNLQFRDKLKEFSLPEYDGPVKWGGHSTIANTVVFGALGFAAGVVADRILDAKFRYSYNHTIPVVIGAMAIGGFLGSAITPEKIEFNTTVQEVVQAFPPHYEKRLVNNGKTTTVRNEGPFYAQTVRIPESDLVLTTKPKDAPFINGEKINATFYYTVKDGVKQIQSWTASAAER